jgi:hypothetical protein
LILIKTFSFIYEVRVLQISKKFEGALPIYWGCVLILNGGTICQLFGGLLHLIGGGFYLFGGNQFVWGYFFLFLGVTYQRYGGKQSWGYVSIFLGVTLIRTF